MVRDKFTGAPRGFAFVHFQSVADSARALQNLQVGRCCSAPHQCLAMLGSHGCDVMQKPAVMFAMTQHDRCDRIDALSSQHDAPYGSAQSSRDQGYLHAITAQQPAPIRSHASAPPQACSACQACSSRGPKRLCACAECAAGGPAGVVALVLCARPAPRPSAARRTFRPRCRRTAGASPHLRTAERLLAQPPFKPMHRPFAASAPDCTATFVMASRCDACSSDRASPKIKQAAVCTPDWHFEGIGATLVHATGGTGHAGLQRLAAQGV